MNVPSSISYLGILLYWCIQSSMAKKLRIITNLAELLRILWQKKPFRVLNANMYDRHCSGHANTFRVTLKCAPTHVAMKVNQANNQTTMPEKCQENIFIQKLPINKLILRWSVQCVFICHSICYLDYRMDVATIHSHLPVNDLLLHKQSQATSRAATSEGVMLTFLCCH